MPNPFIVDFLQKYRKKFDFSHHIIVNEKNKSLYKTIDLDEVVGELDQYNGRMLRVISHKVVQGDIYYLLERSKEILGWFQSETSIELYKKNTEMVRVDFENYVTPPLHNLMNIKGDMNLAFKDKRLLSMYYCFFNGEIYEALYANKRFIGWSHSDHLERGVTLKDVEGTYIKNINSYTVYKNSQLEDTVQWTFNEEETVNVSVVFPKSQIFKINQGTRDGWIQEYNNNQLNIFANITSKREELEDILMYDLLKNIEKERNISKNNMIKLLKENLNLQEELTNKSERITRLTQLYNNLKNSKLGKLQTKIWQSRKGR